MYESFRNLLTKRYNAMIPGTPAKDFYTIKQAATALELTPRTITNYCRSGKMKAYKRAGRWYILPADLVEWITGG